MSKFIPDNIRKSGIGATIGYIIAVLVITALILSAVCTIGALIWNSLMPMIFGLPRLTWYQMMGLWWICQFLFTSMSSNKSK